MNNFKSIIRPYISVLFATAFVYFTYTKLVPIDVFTHVATGIFTYWFATRGKGDNNVNQK